MIGARVIKTSLAVATSVLIAKSLDLYVYQFAGIIAVLSVQPSLYRSLRNGIQQTASALTGAALGAIALFTIGESFLAMGFVAFMLMVFHVYIKWTNSLLVSVVIAINTMGTIGLNFWEAAYSQMALVLIGTGVGTLINLIHKPVHQERAEIILNQAEGMLRVLLHYIVLDLEKNQITPYPFMKEQIDEIRLYLKKGKEISGLIIEDRKFSKTPIKNTSKIFQSFETMAERIHDMSKTLTNIDLVDDELKFSKKSLKIVISMQEKIIQGKRLNLKLLTRVLDQKRNELWRGSDESEGFYNFYGYIRAYLKELEHFLVENSGQIKKQISYSSIDRPGLIAEISKLLVNYDLNITNVSIRVNGEFATTTIEVSCRYDFEGNKMIKEILNVDDVLTVKFD
ncbi:aromatic acid exporter family protein [Cohnella sp.]|uniref:aromatic acid exporter family protein n=1 Tax=Cohnella sp. TaxID=1883426 RepID=UPI003563A92F